MIRKTITIICILLFFTTTALAQQIWTEREGITFGIRGGFDMQNITGINQSGDEVNNSLTPAYNFGFTAEIPLAPHFYLQPGLLYTTKGAEGENETTTFRTTYLELPVNLLYKPILANGNLMVGFGPYVGMGISGNVEGENIEGSAGNADVRFQNTVSSTDPADVEYFRPVDAGANFIVGYEFANRISVQLNAQLGLVDINPNYENRANDNTSLKNTGFGVSVGYRF